MNIRRLIDAKIAYLSEAVELTEVCTHYDGHGFQMSGGNDVDYLLKNDVSLLVRSFNLLENAKELPDSAKIGASQFLKDNESVIEQYISDDMYTCLGCRRNGNNIIVQIPSEELYSGNYKPLPTPKVGGALLTNNFGNLGHDSDITNVDFHEIAELFFFNMRNIRGGSVLRVMYYYSNAASDQDCHEMFIIRGTSSVLFVRADGYSVLYMIKTKDIYKDFNDVVMRNNILLQLESIVNRIMGDLATFEVDTLIKIINDESGVITSDVRDKISKLTMSISSTVEQANELHNTVKSKL